MRIPLPEQVKVKLLDMRLQMMLEQPSKVLEHAKGHISKQPSADTAAALAVLDRSWWGVVEQRKRNVKQQQLQQVR